MIGAGSPRPAYFNGYPSFPHSMSDLAVIPASLLPLRTVRDLIRWGASEFKRHDLVFGHGTDNALDEAFHLVLATLKLPYDLPAVYLESALADDERTEVLAVLRRRVETRKPAPYLTGIAYFCGLEFEVDERALIPRSPIGEMIEAQFQPWLTRNPDSILDLCSGSGCIGIAAAFAFPEATVDLAEIDDGALEVMARNLKRHHLQERVKPVVGDLFAPVAGKRYVPREVTPGYTVTGSASWYGSAFHGRRGSSEWAVRTRGRSTRSPRRRPTWPSRASTRRCSRPPGTGGASTRRRRPGGRPGGRAGRAPRRRRGGGQRRGRLRDRKSVV